MSGDGSKDKLNLLKRRIEGQGGTVLDGIQGEVEVDDRDDERRPRQGPVLVLGHVAKGAWLKLVRPRPLVVMGRIDGRVSGAYAVKAGSIAEGRLDGVRHVEVAQDLGGGDGRARVVFDPCGDPGFLAQAEHGLQRQRVLEAGAVPQREASARQALLDALQLATFEVRVDIAVGGRTQRVFAVYPSRQDRAIELDGRALLQHLVGRIEAGAPAAAGAELLERAMVALKETIAASLQRSSGGGMGAALRQQRGADLYGVYVDAVFEYLWPKQVGLWLETTRQYTRAALERLKASTLALEVKGGVVAPFQLEFPLWQFHALEGRIRPEKIGQCAVTGVPADDPQLLRLTYEYVEEKTWFEQTREVPMAALRGCRLLCKRGLVYLEGQSEPLLGFAE